jgi:hypothetical protein
MKITSTTGHGIATALCFFFSLCDAQDTKNPLAVDTVYASTTKTTSLIFPARIILFDIGSEDYGGVKEDNLLLLKAAHDSAAVTSLIVKTGDQFFHSTIAYSSNPPRLFIDLSKSSVVAAPKVIVASRISKEDSLKTLKERITEVRLNHLLSDPKSYYKNYAVKNSSERLALTLSDLRTDDEQVYLKVLFINGSRIDYHIDFTEFVYQDPITENGMKGAFDRKNVYQTASNHIEWIRAGEERHVGFAIPRYVLGAHGELVIIFREKMGSRAITLTLPFSLILSSPPLQKNK